MTTPSVMDTTALDIVRGYIINHLDKSDPLEYFDIYIVWKAKILQNWKYLISSSLPDGMYYEMTYDGDKQRWYLDSYKKFENCAYDDNHLGKLCIGKGMTWRPEPKAVREETNE